MSTTNDQAMTFEAAYQKLQQVVKDLEKSEITLEASIQKYEEGMKLYRFCEEQLVAAQQRIRLVEDAAQEAIIADHLSVGPVEDDEDENLERHMPPHDEDDFHSLTAADFAEAARMEVEENA